MLQKIPSDDSLNFCAIYEAQNGNMIRLHTPWSLRNKSATSDFIIVRRWQ